MRAGDHRSCNIMGHTLKHAIKNSLCRVNAVASIHYSSRLATLWLTNRQAKKLADPASRWLVSNAMAGT